MGFEKARQKGSHVVMRKFVNEKKIGCVVPIHKEVAIGTFHNILKQAEIDPENFLKNC